MQANAWCWLVLSAAAGLLGAGPACAAGGPEALRAEQKSDRVSIFVGDKVFTEYLFLDSEKYPYFYPVNGPLTGESLTTRRETNYPHHSSIFFGCDKVNGGDYWQEGLERGRIASKQVRLVKEAGPEIVIAQTCLWERPGAEAPFEDTRRIVISAPRAGVRCLDFQVTLKAKIPVKILKTNHSLFSVRMTPELSAARGAMLINAEGKRGEKATFGQPSPWMAAGGVRKGQAEGVALFNHPANRWTPATWFTRDYGFFSPTPMYFMKEGAMDFAPGESFALAYRVMVYAGEWTPEQINGEYLAYAGKK